MLQQEMVFSKQDDRDETSVQFKGYNEYFAGTYKDLSNMLVISIDEGKSGLGGYCVYQNATYYNYNLQLILNKKQ